MTTLGLVLRNLAYHWRTNLAVGGAVIAGTAAIAGALLVGDSVRGSLREISLKRLGQVDHVLLAPRFFREDLANQLAGDPDVQSRFSAVAPALQLQGTFVAKSPEGTRRVGSVQVLGGDDRLWELLETGERKPTGQEVALNRKLADELGAHEGDNVSLWMQLPATIPSESLLGNRESQFREIPLTVRWILPADSSAGRFSLSPTQQVPRNALVPLETLQESLDLARVERSRRNPQGAPARVNALLAAARSPADQTGSTAPQASAALDAAVAEKRTLLDLGLKVVQSPRGYFSLESEQQFLDDNLSFPAIHVLTTLDMKFSPVLAYLANEIVNTRDPKKFDMYSVVAGFDPLRRISTPFGPFEWASKKPSNFRLNEIILNDWLAADLGVKAGDSVTMKYYMVGTHGDLPEVSQTLRVAGIVKLRGPAADPSLVPEVKGITDAKTMSEWKQPWPMKLNLVTKRDEEYWDKYRATPKSYISLGAAQQFWTNRFGSLTSVRVAPKAAKTPQQTAEEFEKEYLAYLSPTQARMNFQPVKQVGVSASVGSNDFSQLFLGFSFFLILAAAILVGLIFRLGIERRAESIGLLMAIGYPPRRLSGLFLLEGLFVVLVGGVLGALAAVGYAELMILGLKYWWNRAIGTQLLSLYVTPQSLETGFVSAVFVGLLAIAWGIRRMKRLSPRTLLSGGEIDWDTAATSRRTGRVPIGVGITLLISVAASVGLAYSGRALQGEAFEGLSWNVVLFFVDGVLLLTAAILLLNGLLAGDRSAAVKGAGAIGAARLGIRNMARFRQRSISSMSLIAVATFVIVAVGAGRRNPALETPDKNSGNGGFRLVAQSTEPILRDLSTERGRAALNLRPKPGSEEERLLSQSKIVALRVKPGDDASCLNVYQTRTPTVLGVPNSLIERGGFRFIGAGEPNPWTLLKRPSGERTVPTIGDANTLQYSLHKGLGDTMPVSNASLHDRNFKIVGMLDGSVFQGVLLISEDDFVKLFPEATGFRYFLIDVPGTSADAQRLSDYLESQLTPYGFDAEPVASRLADFLSVQNTYLSTFQMLGGLGLLLGTLGLATVMIRNVLDRRRELALLTAIGFRPLGLAWLVLVETAALLVCGLLAGAVAAMVAMLPHLSSVGSDVPWGSLSAILLGVFLVGMLAALIASVRAAHSPVLEGLRSE